MFISPRLFYNEGTEGAGGASAAPEGASTTEGAAPENTNTGGAEGADTGATAEVKPEPTLQQPFGPDELKSLGFESIDALKEHLQKQKEANISPEEKAKKENRDKADFLAYAAKNDLLNVDDYNRYESLKGIPDADLVFAQFSSEHKEDNPEATPEEVKEAFDSEYKLNSENEKAKARGLARLTKAASEIKSPLETSYKTAYQTYQDELSLRTKMPDYDKFIDTVINEVVVEEFEAFKVKEGEEEIVVKGKISKEERENIAKMFKNGKTFQQYLNMKPEEFKAALDKKVRGVVRNAKMEEVQKQIWETAKGIGVKQGSTIGAENPYSQQARAKETPVVDIDQSNAKIANAREQYRNGR